jgi:hypothetical protein
MHFVQRAMKVWDAHLHIALRLLFFFFLPHWAKISTALGITVGTEDR